VAVVFGIVKDEGVDGFEAVSAGEEGLAKSVKGPAGESPLATPMCAGKASLCGPTE
jgi:hypothetical protein